MKRTPSTSGATLLAIGRHPTNAIGVIFSVSRADGTLPLFLVTVLPVAGAAQDQPVFS